MLGFLRLPPVVPVRRFEYMSYEIAEQANGCRFPR